MLSLNCGETYRQKITFLLVLFLVFVSVIYFSGQSKKSTYPRYAGNTDIPASPHSRGQKTSEESGNDLDLLKTGLSKILRNLTTWKKELGMTSLMVTRALKHRTSTSDLSRVVIDAVTKKRALHIGVAGGSISAGVYIYANVFAETIESALGVPVEIHNGAIGATDSRFATYCFGALVNITKLDIVLWEYAANDFHKGLGPWAQEEFTRVILDLPNSPQLIYVNFLFGVEMYKKSCESNEIVGSRPLSEYYNVPSISMPDALCDLVKYGNITDLIISRSNNHPTIKYHTMAGVALVELFKRVLNKLINTSALHSLEDMKKLYAASPRVGRLKPIFSKMTILKPKCWTTLKTRQKHRPQNDRQRQRLAQNQLTPINYVDWNIGSSDAENQNRTDLKRFWTTNKANSSITFPFSIPPFLSLNCTVSVAVWGGPDCGSADAFIDRDVRKSIRINSEWKYRVTLTERISDSLAPGDHTLTLIGIGDGFFRISSIMTSYRTVL
ncbi:uncharacterized protein [Ptychodera flava]|uniref:uncharacterized protein isoform X1 n=1 Tax=Ptychodera flava TaxID=63121 RepID=UPI00396A0BBD